jgi:tetratricopeptide (TPR) repeat protein
LKSTLKELTIAKIIEKGELAYDKYLIHRQTINSPSMYKAIDRVRKHSGKLTQLTGLKADFSLHDKLDYYGTIPDEYVKPLQEIRALLIKAKKTASINTYGECLKYALEAKQKSELIGAEGEKERSDYYILLASLKVAWSQEKESLLKYNLKNSEEKHHMLLHAGFLYIKGESLGFNPDTYAQSIGTLKDAADRAVELGDYDIALRALTVLSNTYSVLNDDLNTLNCFYYVMNLNNIVNETSVPTVSVIENTAVSMFNLRYHHISDYFLDKAIAIAESYDGGVGHLAYCNIYKSIFDAENGHSIEAEQGIERALKYVALIRDDASRQRIRCFIVGYVARVKALIGKVDEAIDFYNEALELARNSKMGGLLILSQMHQGLAECLMKQNKCDGAKDLIVIAKKYSDQAASNREVNNKTLTFAVTHKKCEEQAEIIKKCSFAE